MTTTTFKPTDSEMRLAAEADMMNRIIDERNEDIDKIADIMNDINCIAKDIAVEVDIGG